MLHRALEPYESLGSCNSRDGSEGKRSQQTATESRRGRGRRLPAPAENPKGDPENDTSTACAPPPVGTWQPPINPTAGRIPIGLPQCPRRSAINKPLLSSLLVMVVRAHTRQATAVSYPPLHCIASHRIALHCIACTPVPESRRGLRFPRLRPPPHGMLLFARVPRLACPFAESSTDG